MILTLLLTKFAMFPQLKPSPSSKAPPLMRTNILTKVAQNNQTLATKLSSKLPPGLKISVSNTKTPIEGPASKTQPSTPRIVLQSVGSKWQNSSQSQEVEKQEKDWEEGRGSSATDVECDTVPRPRKV